MLPYELTILGCGSASPAKERNPTSHYLKWGSRTFLLDCGEGTQMRMLQYGVKSSRIEHVYITHLHGDHFFGLIGLLTSYGMMKRTAPLKIIGPPGLNTIILQQLALMGSDLPYPIEFITWQAEFAQVFADDQLEVYTIPLSHRIPTCGYLFVEKEGLRKIIREQIAAYQIPLEQIAGIKAGADFTTSEGNLILNKELTTDPKEAKRFAFITDTIYLPEIAHYLQKVDLLYHEATFNNLNFEKAQTTFHSTAEQAAKIALASNAKQLLIGHFSSKIKKEELQDLLNEATVVFPETVLAEEGLKIAF